MNGFIRFAARLLLFTATAAFVFSMIVPSICFGENRYVGSETCGKCHQREYENFMNYAKKSKSFKSIEKLKKGLNEEEVKACYSCHTTGYGKPGGFESPEKTPRLINAGCEVCHGPGEAHVQSVSPRDIKSSMKIEDCETCHIHERVTAFSYKPLIHGGAH